MQQVRPSAEEIVRRGKEMYEREVRDKVEQEHFGKFLVLDIDTGKYAIDPDETAAIGRMMEQNPDGARYILRVGFKTAHRLGGRLVRSTC